MVLVPTLPPVGGDEVGHHNAGDGVDVGGVDAAARTQVVRA
jgi:hypothetical protein